jgi:PmbA protein
MNDDQRLLDLAEAGVKAALAAGAEWADATTGATHDVDVEYERNTIRECSSGSYESLGVRAFVRGGTGLAMADGLDLATAKEVGAQAAEMAKSTTPDPDFHRLPEPKPYAEAPEVFDDAVAGMASAELVQWCLEAIEKGTQGGGEVYLAGDAGFRYGTGALVTSTGIALVRSSSSVGTGVSASVWKDGQAASHYDGTEGRRLADLKRDGLAEGVVEMAGRLIDDEPMPTCHCDLIMDYKTAFWWASTIVAGAEAEGIQRGRSFMGGKEGQRIASQALTVVEDPLVPFGLSSGAWDGEGVPRQKRTLVDHGVLTTYLHNSYTAYKAGVEPTGHATRGGAHVGISFSNLQIELGEQTMAEMIAETENGVWVISGGPYPDPYTGVVSSTVDAGFVIRDGKVGKAVKGAMMTGEIFDLLSRIDGVSKDYEERPGRIMPAIRIRKALISSQ